MIFMYPRNCTDFSNNGLGAVSPSSCVVSETLNGEWELTLVHPIDVDGKWTRLVEGAILKAPVPAAMTPRVSLISQSAGMDVYRVQTDVDEASVRGGTLRLRTGPGTSYGVLKQYSHGTLVTLLDADNASWYEVIAPDGKRGYMDARFLVFDHTEGNVTAATGQVVQARQLREQPFRIYRVVPELAKVMPYLQWWYLICFCKNESMKICVQWAFPVRPENNGELWMRTCRGEEEYYGEWKRVATTEQINALDARITTLEARQQA